MQNFIKFNKKVIRKLQIIIIKLEIYLRNPLRNIINNP